MTISLLTVLINDDHALFHNDDNDTTAAIICDIFTADISLINDDHDLLICLFVLRFYGSVNPMGSCRAQSVYLTTRLLGRLSPLSG